MNYIGKYIKRPRGHVFQVGGAATRMYVAGNFLEAGGERNSDNWKLISRAAEHNKAAEEYRVAKVSTHTAQQAYDEVLRGSGASLPRRDAIDARLVRQIATGKGNLIDSQKQVGGYPALRWVPGPADRDQDGMPDSWETKHGLDPRDFGDAAKDKDGDGYTNIEEWLNDTDPRRKL